MAAYQEQQQVQEDVRADQLHQGTSSQQRPSPVKYSHLRASLDTTGIAGSSSSPRAGHVSPLRHSYPLVAAAGRSPAQRTQSPLQAVLASKETELDIAAAAAVSAGSSGPAVDLARLGVGVGATEPWRQVGAAAATAGSSEAAAQIR
jgi:hypothetical protein